MRKTELLAEKVPKPTRRMYQLAVKQEPVPTAWDTYYYRIGVFARCRESRNGILIIPFYMTTQMKNGSGEPWLIVFLDPANGRYITWLAGQKQPWSTARLTWQAAPVGGGHSLSGWYMPEGELMQLCRRLHESRREPEDARKWDVFDIVNGYQQRLLDARTKERRAREVAPWDRKMEKVEDLPDSFRRWAFHAGCPQHFLIYDRATGGFGSGCCTCCEELVWMDGLQHNCKTHCGSCGAAVTVKCRGRMGVVFAGWNTYLLDDAGGEAVLREVFCQRKLDGSQRQIELQRFVRRTAEQGSLTEHYREFAAGDAPPEYYSYTRYKDREMRWVRQTGRKYPDRTAELWMGNPETLARLADGALKKSGLPAMLRWKERGGMTVNASSYLQEERNCPVLERLAKAGMYQLAAELVEYAEESFGKPNIRRLFDTAGGPLHRELRLTRQQAAQLREKQYGRCAFETMQRGEPVTEETLRCIDRHGIRRPWEIGRPETGLSIQKRVNYLRRQKERLGQSYEETARLYRDYLDMAARLGRDIRDPIVCLQPDLKRYHDQYAEELNRREKEAALHRWEAEFPQIRQEAARNRKLFGWETDEFLFLVPGSTEEFVQESWQQHNCVGASDRYILNMAERRSFIVFLRRKEAAEQAFYTIEISAGGTVLQAYSAYNRKEHWDEVKDVIRQWAARVRKRLKKERPPAPLSPAGPGNEAEEARPPAPTESEEAHPQTGSEAGRVTRQAGTLEIPRPPALAAAAG